jgi:hypothetical protein
VHDANQYFCMGVVGIAGAMNTASRGLRAGAMNATAGNRILASSFQV